MNTRTIRIVCVVGLLFAASALTACSSDHEFWDRSPRVGGARQFGPPCTPITPAPADPQPAPRIQPPTERPAARAPAAAPPAAHASGSSEEAQVLALVNRIRAQHSLRTLRFHPTLWSAARDHSLEQERHGYMGHGSPDPARARLAQRMAIAGYQGRVFAEVVAWGYTSVEAVVEGWMNSSDHRRILLDPELTEAGFSRVGQYWTGNLGAPFRFGAGAAPRVPRPTERRAPSVRPRATPAPVLQARPAPKPAPRPAPKPAPDPQLPPAASPFG